MSKFKPGDWIREDDMVPGGTMIEHGYYVYDVLPTDDYIIEVKPGDYQIWPESTLDSCALVEGCTGWDWVMPKPIEPGEGYRLLSPEEPVIEGDEYFTPGLGWSRSGNYGGTQPQGFLYR